MSMEAEYDAILSEDFPGPEHVSLHDHHHDQHHDHHHDQQILDAVQLDHHSPVHDTHELTQSPAAGESDVDASGEDKNAERERKRGLGHLTAEERKERQKNQNRKAAERSRNKRKQEMNALEVTVNNIQQENERLRVRLNELLSSKKSSTPSDPVLADAVPASSTETGLDYAYLSRLQNELSSAKSTLLERELELARLRGAENSADVDVLRHLLLSHHTTLTSLTAEAGSLESMITHLQNERSALTKQADIITRELEARKALQGMNSEDVDAAIQGNAGRSVGVERALLDIRGLVDEAVRSWEQTSVLPPSKDGENGMHGIEVDANTVTE